LARMQLATTEAQVFRNVTIILMTVVGRTKESSASDLGYSPQRWIMSANGIGSADGKDCDAISPRAVPRVRPQSIEQQDA